MKRQDDLGVGGSIFMTVVFAAVAFFTYQIDPSDPSGILLAWIPGVGVIVGIIMTIIATNKASNESARKDQQESFGKTISHDSSFGNGDLKLNFNSSAKKVTVCATTISETNQKVIDGFVKASAVQTDNHIVALDSTSNKVIRAKSNNGNVMLGQANINEELSKLGVTVTDSKPTLKHFNDYAFITDDKNEFVTIVTPAKIHVLRYSDIVSISYEENGSDVYNKSVGGAVVGGLLFGGVGAIVGGNTAKATQNKEIRMMSIKILLKSTSDSTIILKIYEAGPDGNLLETKKDADRMHYEGLMKEVTGIKDIFAIILDMVDKKVAQQKIAPVMQPVSSTSVADELAKLANLKADGILTDEEFQAQKKKLLGLKDGRYCCIR